MNTPKLTTDYLWRSYQMGQGSADHTAKQVFDEVIGPVLAQLAARDAELARGREDKEMLRDALVKESQYRQETERQRAALEAALDAAMKDAERYRFLRDDDNWCDDDDAWERLGELSCLEFDDAIDDAMREALNDCSVWDQQVALDPLVSSEAEKLRDTYKAERNALRRLALLLAHQLFHSQPHFNYRKSNLHVKRFLALILGKQVMSGLSAKTQGPAVRVLRDSQREHVESVFNGSSGER